MSGIGEGNHVVDWSGSSDSPETIERRAHWTPSQRLAWLEGSIVFAATAGLLRAEWRARQQRSDQWARQAGLA